MKIRGNTFLWTPLIVSIIYQIFLLIPEENYIEILRDFVVLYGVYNIIGLVCMVLHYKAFNVNSSSYIYYYWDINYWYKIAPKEYVREKTKLKISSEYGKFPFFRLGSISCWLVFGLILLNQWFNKYLTFKL